MPKPTFNKEKLVDMKIHLDTTIKELELEVSYKCIGMNREHSMMKEKTTKEHYRRIHMIVKE